MESWAFKSSTAHLLRSRELVSGSNGRFWAVNSRVSTTGAGRSATINPADSPTVALRPIVSCAPSVHEFAMYAHERHVPHPFQVLGHTRVVSNPAIFS
jgi:hypothetical protein